MGQKKIDHFHFQEQVPYTELGCEKLVLPILHISWPTRPTSDVYTSINEYLIVYLVIFSEWNGCSGSYCSKSKSISDELLYL